MDYEKKYKEAVNKIKNLLDDGEKNGFTIVTYKTDLESIFPELKESEDEKIRKELLAVIDDLILPDEQKERFVAWLERQSEKAKIEALRTEYEKGRADAIAEMQVAWSEEDEEEFQIAIDTLVNAGQHDSANWLKSLKNRYTWKPSDEQMASITCAVRNMKESACYDSELVSLLNDLKKL